MAQVIVELSYDPPFTAESLQADLARLRMCLLVREIVTVAVHAAENGRRAILVLEARDAEAARNAFRSAGVPFERAWSVRPASDPSRP